jgi:putative transposase
MLYEPNIHHRRSIRLRGYDYAQAGVYFVTICAQGRECLFGEIVGGEMLLNEYGRIVAECWDDIAHHFSTVELDATVVMPNHMHGVIVLLESNDNVGARFPHPDGRGYGRGYGRGHRAPTPTTDAVAAALHRRPTLGQIVAYAKYQSTKRINVLRDMPGLRVWQRNYYEHIIRDEADLLKIREYVVNNPARWEFDQLHPDHPSKW